MRKVVKTAGVTLLEIMLVLAVAAMVIVMSIRYYQSAQVSQQANMALSSIQAIAAGADNLAIGGGSYSAIGTTGGTLFSVIGSANAKSPNGGLVSITGPTSSTYTVTMVLTPAVCLSVGAKLKANKKITMTGTGCTGATLSYVYNNTI